VRNILKEDKIPMSAITRDKIYPVLNNQSGSIIANPKFVKGLESLGFGKYSPDRSKGSAQGTAIVLTERIWFRNSDF